MPDIGLGSAPEPTDVIMCCSPCYAAGETVSAAAAQRRRQLIARSCPVRWRPAHPRLHRIGGCRP